MNKKTQDAKCLLIQMESLKTAPAEGNTMNNATLLEMTLQNAEAMARQVLRTSMVLERSNAAIRKSQEMLARNERLSEDLARRFPGYFTR